MYVHYVLYVYIHTYTLHNYIYFLFPPSDVRGQCPPTPQELIDNVKITDWFRFGLELKIDDRTLHGIERDPSLQRISDKLREVFRIWLNEGEEDPTWRTVVTALKTIKENKLARDIEKKFC